MKNKGRVVIVVEPVEGLASTGLVSARFPSLGNNLLDSQVLGRNTGAYVQEALELAFPIGTPPEQRLVMNLTAYIDESGTHDASEVIAVAGFLSDTSKWVNFSVQWESALDDFGLSGGFHMADFANRVPPYDVWTEEERRQRLSRLLNIIKNNALVSFGVSFQKKAFDLLFSDRAKAICGGPYGLAAMNCYMDVGRKLHDLNWDGRVAYVLESGAKGAGQMSRVFLSNLNRPEQSEGLHLLSLRFERKREFLPLQAADILAYELYKQLPKTLKLDSRAPRYPLKFLAEIPHSWGFLDGYELQKFSSILSIRSAMEDAGELNSL